MGPVAFVLPVVSGVKNGGIHAKMPANADDSNNRRVVCRTMILAPGCACSGARTGEFQSCASAAPVLKWNSPFCLVPNRLGGGLRGGNFPSDRRNATPRSYGGIMYGRPLLLAGGVGSVSGSWTAVDLKAWLCV